MRHLILFFTLFASLHAFQYDAKFYMGVGGGIQYETFTKEYSDAQNTPYFGSLKFGYGDIRAYSVEFVLNYIDNKSNIFSPNDQARYGMDVMLLKAFDLTHYLYPYFRAGFGAGEMKVQRLLEDKIAYSSFNIGAGVFIPLAKSGFDLELNYEYRFTSYQSVDLIADKLKLQSHINQFYLGINYRF